MPKPRSVGLHKKPFLISPHVPNHTLSPPIHRPFSSIKTSSLDSSKKNHTHQRNSYQLTFYTTTANRTISLKTHLIKPHPPSRPVSSYSKTNLPPSQASIPASTPLPPGWSTNTAHLTRDVPQYFEFSAYDLPPLTPLALSRDNMAFLISISSSGEHLLFNGISGTLHLIKRARPNPSSSSRSSSSPVVSTLLQAMRDDRLETVEVDALPEEGEYADVEGWTIYPDEKVKEMKDLVPRDGDFEGKRVTLIMGRRNDDEEVLLFRSDWRYLLYKEGMIYQVVEPMKLGAIIPRLIEDRNEENLLLQEVRR